MQHFVVILALSRRVDPHANMLETGIIPQHSLNLSGVLQTRTVVVQIEIDAPDFGVTLQKGEQRDMRGAAERKAVAVPLPAVKLLQGRVRERVDRRLKDRDLTAARLLGR